MEVFGPPVCLYMGIIETPKLKHAELTSCMKVEVAVPNKPTVSVDVKQHFNTKIIQRLLKVSGFSKLLKVDTAR